MCPFSEGDLSEVLRAHLGKIVAEIAALDADYVLKASAAQLEEHFVDKARLEPLVLDVDHGYIENRVGVDVDVSRDFLRAIPPGQHVEVRGTRLDIAIPYCGDKELWRCRPSSYSISGYPDIEVLPDRVRFSVTFPDDAANTEEIKRRIDRAVRELAEAASTVGRDVEKFNAGLRQQIALAVEGRKRRAQETSGVVAGLGIPIRRAEEPVAYAVPAKRKRIMPRLPAVQAEPYQPEYYLPMEEYEHILGVLRSMSLTIERNPRSFERLKEEDIRTHFLLFLNGYYEGTATGETFNAAGKTDIMIRAGDRNVFIAECKFWRGEESFDAAVSQLLGYLSWRDSKCALLVFNRNRDSTAVYGKMHKRMVARQECRRSLGPDTRGDNRYIFVKGSDPGREITITTMLFDMPAGDGGSVQAQGLPPGVDVSR